MSLGLTLKWLRRRQQFTVNELSRLWMPYAIFALVSMSFVVAILTVMVLLKTRRLSSSQDDVLTLARALEIRMATVATLQDSLITSQNQQLDRLITLLAAKGPMEYQALRSDVTLNEEFVSTSDEAELERLSYDQYGAGRQPDQSAGMEEFLFGNGGGEVPYIAN